MPSAGLLKPLPPSMECTTIARSDAACCVRVDLHDDPLTARTIATSGCGVTDRKIARVAREQVRELLAGLPRPSVVAIETGVLHRWLWTEAEPIGEHFQRFRGLNT
jgi:hypothetical protein